MRYLLEPLVHIHPFSPESLGTFLYNANAFTLNSMASATWPSSNRAIYVPFQVYKTITAVKLWVVNGSAVSGNIDVGIYTSTGTRLISSGSTAQSGTTAVQEFDITDTTLGPGTYYLAAAMDNTTGTVLRATSGSVQQLQMAGMAIQGSAFPLPSSFTLASSSGGTSLIPFIGLSTRSVI